MKQTILTLFFLKSIIIFAQNIQYVNTTNGLNVRAESNSNSQKVTALACGAEVEIIEETGIELSIMDEGEKLSGQWVKIKSTKNNTTGFVFNGFLIAEKPTIYYIANFLGAKVYEKPTFSSKFLYRFPLGKSIIVAQAIETDEIYKVGIDFSFSGQWVKPRGVKGYIFSANLTKHQPLRKEGAIISIISGKEKSKRKETKMVKIDGQQYEQENEITEYENMTYTFTAFDGCFDHVYVYKNAQLSEVYHQMIIEYVEGGGTGDNKTFEIPKSLKKKGNEYLFEGDGATQDLKIIVNDNGTFTVSSYDCT